MYSKLIEEGLLANPDFVENKELTSYCLLARWKDRSLFLKLKERRIGLLNVDEIFRKHHATGIEISEWTAVKETMKEIKEDVKPFLPVTPEVRKMLAKEKIKLIDEKINRLRVLEEIESNLFNRMKKLFGSAGMRKLVHDSEKDIRQWPCFSGIMNDLYHLLKPVYKLEPRCQSPRKEKTYQAKHSKELYTDIASLLKEYYPTYFKDIDQAHVKSRIKHSS